MGEIRFGDFVQFNIPGEATGRGAGYVLGVMAYSDKEEVVLLGTEDFVGMPIARAHCKAESSGHEVLASNYRRRYEDRFGRERLKPLSAPPSPKED